MRMEEGTRPQAIGYVRALHASCVDCHEAKAAEVDRPILAECGTCHKMDCNRFEERQIRRCASCHE